MKKRIVLIIAVVFLKLCTIGAEVSCAATAAYTYDFLSRLTKVQYDNGAFISFVYDPAGNISQITTNNQTIFPGDIDGDENVTLTDAILSLQVVSGQLPSSNISGFQDINNDHKIGMEEVIFVLRKVATEN